MGRPAALTPAGHLLWGAGMCRGHRSPLVGHELRSRTRLYPEQTGCLDLFRSAIYLHAVTLPGGCRMRMLPSSGGRDPPDLTTSRKGERQGARLLKRKLHAPCPHHARCPHLQCHREGKGSSVQSPRRSVTKGSRMGGGGSRFTTDSRRRKDKRPQIHQHSLVPPFHRLMSMSAGVI